MNNRAFTLVELTAIIVVLAAIFLVSFPTLINTAKSDENRKYDDMVEDLCLAGESYIYANIDDYPELSIPNSKIYLNITKLIKYGSVKKDIINPKTEEIVDNHFVVFDVLGDKSLDCNYEKAKCIVTKNVQDVELDEWDEILCGTESFYVIPNDPDAHPSATGNNVTLLAKYNLNVGADTVEGEIGIQNKKTKGVKFSNDENLNILIDNCNFTQQYLDKHFSSNSSIQKHIEFYKMGYGCNATLPFAETCYWGGDSTGSFVYDNRSLLYPYIQNYKQYMEKLGLEVKEASLASYNQLAEDLGNEFNNSNIYGKMLANDSSFWLGSVGACPDGIESYHDALCVIRCLVKKR